MIRISREIYNKDEAEQYSFVFINDELVEHGVVLSTNLDQARGDVAYIMANEFGYSIDGAIVLVLNNLEASIVA